MVLGNNMKQKQKALKSPTASVHGDEEAINLVSSSSGEKPLRRIRRTPCNSNDFKFEILEFKGKLDLDELLEWLHTVEQIFDCKHILKDEG